MSGFSLRMNAHTARQWLFVGFWTGFGLVMGGAMAFCTVAMGLQGARLLLGAFE